MRRNGQNGQATDGSVWEYAPAPEARNIVKIQPRYGLFIDGEFVAAAQRTLF
jgi:aldehyde dehydrogenase (NAD+)